MDSPIAICYLLHEDDEQNRLWLTTEHLYVQAKGKLRRFDLDRIQHVATERRRWWFPVVAGGILAPLSLVAILLHLYNPWWLISLLVGSMLLWYWGATQHDVLSIHQHHHRQDIPLATVSPNLLAFMRFTNRFLQQRISPLYVKAEVQAWQEAQHTHVYQPETLQEQGFITAYTEEMLNNKMREGEFWFRIDPLKVVSPIRFKMEKGVLMPRIYGAIPLAAVSNMTNPHS